MNDRARDVVDRRFAVEDGRLIVGGAPLGEIASAHGTPLYVYDRSVVEATWRDLRAALPDAVDVFYSVKANPNGAILEWFVERGLGLEIASAGELERALAAGCPPGRIVFAGPGKTDAELERALAAGIGELHVESTGEAGRLGAIAARRGVVAPVVLRVNPAGEVGGAAMRMGGRPSPFGIDEEAIDEAVDRVEADDALDLLGVHLYVGTQILDAEALAGHARRAAEVAARVAARSGRPVRTIDLGGGLGVPYFEHERRLDLAAYGDALGDVLAAAGEDPALADARWIVEPGRYLVAEAGLYVVRVVDVKTSRGETFVVADGGMHHHLAASGNLGQAIPRPFPIVAAERMDEPAEGPASLVGPLCTPLDVLGRRVALPGLEPGDLLAVLQSGAYGRSASPLGFLSHAAPPEVWVGEGRAERIDPVADRSEGDATGGRSATGGGPGDGAAPVTGVVPVGQGDFEEVYEAFLAADDPVAERSDWRRLFEWGDEGEPRGWALRDGGRLVGFLGAVIRRRTAGGEAVAFCNLHSWIVDPDHRGRSLLLLRPILAREELVLTDFSPTPEVERIDRRLGFRRLDARLRILPAGVGRAGTADVECRPEAVAARLDPADARAVEEHRGRGLGHAWAEDDRGGCWVAYSVIERHPVRHLLVHRIGDPATFARTSGALRASLLDRHDARFLAVPDRLLGGGRVPWSFRLPMGSRQWVRSTGAVPPIDTLYSEIAALALTTLPDTSAWIGDRVRGWRREGRDS